MYNPTFLITNEAHHSLEKGSQFHNALLDTSKVFDKVWRDGLIFKLLSFFLI